MSFLKAGSRSVRDRAVLARSLNVVSGVKKHGLVAGGRPAAEEGEDDQVVLAGRGDGGLDGLDDGVVGGDLAVPLVVRRREQQLGPVGRDAEVLRVGEQVVEGLGVGVGGRPRRRSPCP